jgi:uncharacterized protein
MRATYASPARAGLLLGMVLLASFVLAGRGIGASGAFASAAGAVLDRVAPASVAAPALADRIPASTPLAEDWIALELIGVVIGGFLSALVAGRLRRGEAPIGGPRVIRALLGGALMGLGARLAYGCTSGLALSGGAMLVTGAWVFIPIAFGTAMLVTRLAAPREV